MNRNTSKHLVLRLEDLSDGFQKDKILFSLSLPDRNIPKSFLVEDEDSLCFGYYLIYDRPTNEHEIFSMCRKGEWEKLAHHIGDFLVVYIDLKEQELFALSDIFGTFPLFISTKDGRLTLSSDFGVVVKLLGKKTINLSEILDFAFSGGNITPTNQTIVEQVQQLPPGTLLRITPDGRTEFNNLQSMETFIKYDSTPYDDAGDFLRDFLHLLDKILEEMVGVLGTSKLEVDLSSGFDCTLVAYALSKIPGLDLTCCSRISKLALGDTDPEVMMEFARKHNLKLKTIDVEQFYPYCNQGGRDWTVSHFYPGIHGLELMSGFFDFIVNRGLSVNFTGNGGDEIYMSPGIDRVGKYSLQEDYFQFVQFFKSDAMNIFTAEGKSQILDRRRFAKKQLFPSYISVSAVTISKDYFPLIWEKDLWWVHPLTDPRLIQLARRIPLKSNGQPMDKYELWAHRPDIFLPKQAKVQGHYGTHFGQFVTKRPQFIIDVLRNSILGKLGIIKQEEIINNLEKGIFDPYLDTALLFLQQVVRIEYFLQQNDINLD
ncbi:MAG: hypothetical protein Q7S03_03865 [bacterium]|nr:hypothetical protein [bacterium]